MKKKELKKLYLEKRNSINIELLSQRILNNIKSINYILKYENYHIFLSINNKNEIYTQSIIDFLKIYNKNIIIPKSNFSDNSMSSYLYEENTIIEENKYGIPEPINGKKIDDSSIDVIFIPLLAFDKRGYRVGYGKGFYDRFLSKCKKNILKIGLSFFNVEEENIFDINEFDVKLDLCITPNKIYKF